MKSKIKNIIKIKKRNKRGKRNSAQSVVKSLILTGFNPDGAKSKMTTIKKLIRESNATIVTMQETKCTQYGQMKFDGFYTYEHLRSNKEGGGVAICALKELNPVFVCDGGEEVEALTVDIHLRNMAVSVTSAYGPQLNDLAQKKKAFWKYLSEKAQAAKASGKGFILQGDLNCWLGPELLPGDIHEQNRNGKLLQSFLKENRLTCVNSLPLTQGLITRSRTYKGKVKESTIDFYVVCERVLPLVTSMKICDDKEHKLTNYSMLNDKNEAVNSDHAPLVMEVKLEANPAKKVRTEIHNFEDNDSQLKFKESTSNTDAFTDCFQSLQPVLKQSDKWLQVVKTYINKSFKKIRIRPRRIRPSPADRLINKRNKLQKQGALQEVKSLDAQIAKIISEEGRKKSLMFKKFCDRNESGAMSEMWRLKKKLFPKKACALPSAKLDYRGKMITEPKELTKLIGEEYGRVRLRKRPTHPLNLEGKHIRKKLLKLKLRIASRRKTPQFQMKDLEMVLRSLKNKKARGPEGLSRTIFKESTIGSNLKDSLLIMFNKLKENGEIPNFMRRANVTTIPKKGSKIKLDN